MDKKTISQLIHKHICGTLTSDEKQQLEQWLEESDQHLSDFTRLLDEDSLGLRYEQYAEVDEEKAWRIFQKEHYGTPLHHSIHISSSFLKYAAAVLVLVVAGAGWWYSQYTKVTPPVIPEQVQLAMIQSQQSGKQDASIEHVSREELVANPFGRTLDDIQESSSSVGINQSPSSVTHSTSFGDDNTLTKEQLLAARRITTKHDKEFWLTLEDGTLVHLNYNTHLIYPEKFGRGDRNVILDGEAYFMVAKDKSRPFVVHTVQGDVKVYGTEFNVNTRMENHTVSVVLVKGSVGFTLENGKEMMMSPGQELLANNRYPSGYTVNAVDLAPYIAWNEGNFSFQEWPLERVMEVMSRWYGYQVRFGNDHLKQIGISGKLGRYNEAETTMDAIATITGLKITINGNIITINP